LAQRLIHEETTARVQELCLEARSSEDIDIKEHLQDLLYRNMVKNDWEPFPLFDMTEGLDLVQPLFEKYLEDLHARKKEAEFGSPPPAVLLRKTVRLQEIDVMIEELQLKAIGLAKSAGEQEAILAEEKRLQGVRDTIKRFHTKKIEFQPRAVYQRSLSFKGRNRVPLFQLGGEQSDFQEKMLGADHDFDPRPVSREHNRYETTRPVRPEYARDHNKPTRDEPSQLSMTQNSDVAGSASGGESPGPTAEREGAQLQALFAAKLQAASGGTGEGGGMSELEKLQFKTEIKEEMRPLMREMADERAARVVN
jgi:hypothetical protein